MCTSAAGSPTLVGTARRMVVGRMWPDTAADSSALSSHMCTRVPFCKGLFNCFRNCWVQKILSEITRDYSCSDKLILGSFSVLLRILLEPKHRLVEQDHIVQFLIYCTSMHNIFLDKHHSTLRVDERTFQIQSQNHFPTVLISNCR